jgi:hypothetical protein
MVDAGEQQDIGAVDEVLPVGVVRGHHVLEIDGDRRTELARDRQQLSAQCTIEKWASRARANTPRHSARLGCSVIDPRPP